MTFFSKIWEWMKAFGSDALVFLAPYGRLLVKSGGAALMSIAVNAATTMATTDLTNDEKREQAVKKITADAVAQGLSAGQNAIRATLELAVAQLKEKQG